MPNKSNGLKNILVSIACLLIIAGAGLYIHKWVKENRGDDKGRNSQSTGETSRCVSNVRQTWLGLRQFAEEHGGALPQKVSDLYPTYVKSPLAVVCPDGDPTFDTGKSVAEVRRDMDSSDPIKVFAGVRGNSPENWVICYCDSSHHKGDVNICFVNGKYATVSKKEFSEIVQRQTKEMSGTR